MVHSGGKGKAVGWRRVGGIGQDGLELGEKAVRQSNIAICGGRCGVGGKGRTVRGGEAGRHGEGAGLPYERQYQ